MRKFSAMPMPPARADRIRRESARDAVQRLSGDSMQNSDPIAFNPGKMSIVSDTIYN
jgi:hypothetical protein